MKKSILFTVLFAFIATFAMAQPLRMARPFIDFSKYEKTDSFLLKGVYAIHVDSVFNLPTEAYLSIKTDAERKTAIVAPPYGTPFMVYNIEENERRIVFWYQDNRIYCGLIYDKIEKVYQRFTERKKSEFNRRMHGFGFRPRR